jgi:hypothetical protein
MMKRQRMASQPVSMQLLFGRQRRSSKLEPAPRKLSRSGRLRGPRGRPAVEVAIADAEARKCGVLAEQRQTARCPDVDLDTVGMYLFVGRFPGLEQRRSFMTLGEAQRRHGLSRGPNVKSFTASRTPRRMPRRMALSRQLVQIAIVGPGGKRRVA